jgi:hypothetical protein
VEEKKWKMEKSVEIAGENGSQRKELETIAKVCLELYITEMTKF